MTHDAGPPSPADSQGPAPAPEGRLSGVLTRKPLTVRRAVRLIAAFTLVVTVLGGLMVWLLDRQEFSSLGDGLWFSLQTVTTVGYGDLTPADSTGRLIAALLMLAGISVLAVVTAAVTATLIESARARAQRTSDAAQAAHPEQDPVVRQLSEISARLEAIESRLPEDSASRPDG